MTKGKLTAEQIKEAGEKAIKNLRLLSNVDIKALNAMYFANKKFVPNKERNKV